MIWPEVWPTWPYPSMMIAPSRGRWIAEHAAGKIEGSLLPGLRIFAAGGGDSEDPALASNSRVLQLLSTWGGHRSLSEGRTPIGADLNTAAVTWRAGLWRLVFQPSGNGISIMRSRCDSEAAKGGRLQNPNPTVWDSTKDQDLKCKVSEVGGLCIARVSRRAADGDATLHCTNDCRWRATLPMLRRRCHAQPGTRRPMTSTRTAAALAHTMQ
jgi:hypothetical protein